MVEHTRRAGRWLLPAVACAAIGGGWAYHDARSRIEVRVEGEVVEVAGGDLTVGEVLVGEGVAVGPYDEVSPALLTLVSHGLEVDIRRAQPVDVVDGAVVTTHWTAATTVGELLAELGRAGMSSSPPADAALPAGGRVVLRAVARVVVEVDGAARTVVAPVGVVADVLASAGITVDADDEVTPPVGATIADGAVVRVVRVERVTEVVAVEVAAPVATVDDPLAAPGTEEVRAEGRPGTSRQTVVVERRDGVEVARTVVAEEVVTPPATRIVVRGPAPATTTSPTAPPTTAPPTAPPTTAAPPRTTTTAPPPAPTTSTAPPPASGSQTGGATWFGAPAGTCAHPTLAFGTTVTVTNLATGVSVPCRVADRGPFAAGRIVDLAPDVFGALAPLQRGVIDVSVSW